MIMHVKSSACIQPLAYLSSCIHPRVYFRLFSSWSSAFVKFFFLVMCLSAIAKLRKLRRLRSREIMKLGICRHLYNSPSALQTLNCMYLIALVLGRGCSGDDDEVPEVAAVVGREWASHRGCREERDNQRDSRQQQSNCVVVIRGHVVHHSRNEDHPGINIRRKGFLVSIPPVRNRFVVKP